ncbi:ectoine/hydroxyectoine ABC transporter permease subunit EhuC [Clostridium tyrobutyricum]|jgi:polar amino acid transport system permease protein|uniref:Polar amino acid ABC transporter, inner membrane subunit n=2 Tax=Clostridium tyrobutyricum TaxID=1519 RepID=W6N4P3_CLOTY|nr:ectoine/hydroxyectoine ABC transporter permease subunit EhuC [Clostridium tyrobutyricum]AND83930.1 amino acid ABC transporter permease [Clostridium tyrobutyricum]ANP68670.1 ectoine/hydroxyectoine ABC transporter permease subunit EhuC [Clostridium tyrobutyricum]MBR9647091.1 ectoine/hydroxyectoine ABC transporter permease subunit EhuC [Clostridium tyrobutyricum]MBV4415704.1 ectoine/hydroxyectoine ABC transporter permease subunit EhuC [Clostridium tyrobutyricum]MBV4423213.1 ectoine/hydroxyecto
MDIDFIKNILPILLKGSVMTVELTVITIILGSILGILLALLRLSNNLVLKYVSNFYTWIFRGTPLLLQLFFFYYGLPFIGIELTPFTAAVIGLALNCGAYMAEIIRGGIQSIDQGQFEAAKALGFSYTQTMKRIILPQTFKVIIPPVGNEFISILKDTSLVSTIAMVELMRSAQQIYATSFDPISVFLTAAVFYLIMTTVFTTVFGIIERRLSVYN